MEKKSTHTAVVVALPYNFLNKMAALDTRGS